MLQFELPKITISEELFARLASENKNARLERMADGTLVALPPVGLATSIRNAHLTAQLGSWTSGDAKGVAFASNAGFRLPDSAFLSPDASWLAVSRWRALTREEREGFGPLCPDFVVELLPAGDEVEYARAKLKEFIANGAGLGWLIDPLRRVVEIYRPNAEPEIIQNPEAIEGEGPVAGFVLDLRPIFDVE